MQVGIYCTWTIFALSCLPPLCLISTDYTFIFSPSQCFHKVFMRVEFICSPTAYKHYNSYCGCQHALEAQTEEMSRTQATSLKPPRAPFSYRASFSRSGPLCPLNFLAALSKHCVWFQRNILTLSACVFKLKKPFRKNPSTLMNPLSSHQSTPRSLCLTCNLITVQSQQSGMIKKSANHLTKINNAPSQTANFVPFASTAWHSGQWNILLYCSR